MIKLKNILHQIKEGLDPVDNNEETLQLIKKKCFYDEGMPIYKGFQSLYNSNRTLIKITDNGIRRSANTSNHYTILTSQILDSWKDYPKRNRCLVCTTRLNVARGYSTAAYQIYPNKSIDKIGVCSKSDMWDSFLYLKEKVKIRDLYDFNNAFQHMFRIARTVNKNQIAAFENSIVMIDSIDDLQSTIKRFGNKMIDEYEESTHRATNAINLMTYIIDVPDCNVYNALNDLLSPENNGFMVLTIPEFINQANGESREVWFELKDDSYGKLIKEQSD